VGVRVNGRGVERHGTSKVRPPFVEVCLLVTNEHGTVELPQSIPNRTVAPLTEFPKGSTIRTLIVAASMFWTVPKMALKAKSRRAIIVLVPIMPSLAQRTLFPSSK
jgi:hypothetical protein